MRVMGGWYMVWVMGGWCMSEGYGWVVHGEGCCMGVRGVASPPPGQSHYGSASTPRN